MNGDSEAPAPVLKDVNLSALALHIEVVRELALEALRALPMSEVFAHNRLWVNTCATTADHSYRNCMLSRL